MTTLITGAAGFIGSNLAKVLLEKKQHVIGIDNLITGSRKNIQILKSYEHFTFIQDDIVSMDLSKLPLCDIIFHLASPASPVQYKKHPVETLMVNSLGTKRLLDFMRDSKSRTFVFSSTSEVYGDPLQHPQKESYWGNVNPVGVRSCYDEAKRFAESLIMSYFRTYGLNIRIARIFNTYGPHMEKDDGRVVSNFIMQSLLNKDVTVYGDGLQTRSFCYIDDMVEGLISIAKTPGIKGEIINLGNPYETDMVHLARQIIDLAKSSSSVVFQPIDNDDPKKRKPDITKAKTMLKWIPKTDLTAGLRQTISYFKTRFL